MATNISFGTYTPPPASKEPWQESQYRDTSQAYYTQSVNMMVNNLSHCITAITSLVHHQCYSDPDPKKGEIIPTVARKHYLIALTVFINNCGEIIDAESVLTKFKTVFDKNSSIHDREFIIDKSYQIQRIKTACSDKEKIHDSVINKKLIKFKGGKNVPIKTFHKFIVEASICNRRTDVNYTNMKVTKSREELNDLLDNLALAGGAIGFVETKGAEVLAKGVNYFCYALDIQPKYSIAEHLFPLVGPVHLDKKTTHKYYKAVQNHDDLEFYQKEISAKEAEASKTDNASILERLEEIKGLNIKI
ncbi:hypothetical protein ABF176_002448 [Flavobacterium psychrophilum]